MITWQDVALFFGVLALVGVLWFLIDFGRIALWRERRWRLRRRRRGCKDE